MATDHDDERNVDAAFDELARRAGAALRKPAPEDGVGEIARRTRRERIIKNVAVSGVVVVVVGGGIVMLNGNDEPDMLVPTETVSVDSTVPTLPVSPVDTTSPGATVPTIDPVTTTTDMPEVASTPVTSVTIPWVPVGTDETTIQLLERTVTPSSIGDLRWTVLESTSGEGFGSRSYPVRGPRGFMSARDGDLVISEDAVTWRPVTAPFPGVPLGLMYTDDGRFELAVRADNGSTQYWQSSDLEAWSLARDESNVAAFSGRIDGPGLVKEVFARPFRGQVPTLPDGTTLTSVSVGLDIRGQIAVRVADDEFQQALADGVGAEIWWQKADASGLSGIAGVAVIQDRSWGTWSDAKAESSGAFEVELSISGTPDDWVVEVRNPSNDESLGVVRGSISAGDLAATLEALIYAGFHEWFVVDGDTAELVDPDWADPAEAGMTSFATIDNGSFVFVTAGANYDELAIWRSIDGRSWENLDPVGWNEAAPSWAQMAQIYQAPSGGLLAVFSGGRGELAFLTSADGVNWQTAEQPPVLRSAREGSGFDSFVHATERGFILIARPWAEDEHFAEVWTSGDGHVWEPVDADKVIAGNIADKVPTGAGADGSASNLVTTSRSYEQGRQIDWLIEVM